MSSSNADQAKLAVTLASTIALSAQFSIALESNGDVEPTRAGQSPLSLLATASALLKSQVTKLSLLAITGPFTASAITSVLTTVNDSILPSLATGALLVTDVAYTKLYSTEVRFKTRSVLRNITSFAKAVNSRAQDSAGDVSSDHKQSIVEATGYLWEDCDSLKSLADGDLSQFLYCKTQQWLSLLKDAIQELEEWDPAEEDDFFGEELSLTGDAAGDIGDKESSQTKAIILPVWKRLLQSMRAAVKYRVQNSLLPTTKLSTDQVRALDTFMQALQHLSEQIDEAAEALYSNDVERCMNISRLARNLCVGILQKVQRPWHDDQDDADAGKQLLKALRWIEAIDLDKK